MPALNLLENKNTFSLIVEPTNNHKIIIAYAPAILPNDAKTINRTSALPGLNTDIIDAGKPIIRVSIDV